MKKVSTRVYIFQKVLDYLGVAFLGVLLLFIWQLYRGPIEVPFLKPYIMQALNSDSSEAEISVGNVSIELVRSLQPIKIVAKDISYKRRDESVNVKAPRTTVSFSLKALLRGIVAPSSIAVESPVVYVFSDYGVKEDNKNEVDKQRLGYHFKMIEDFLERFNADDNSYIESYINSIKISGGELELHEVDLGRKWSFSDLNYKFERNLLNISTELNALVNLGSSFATVGLEGEYRPLKQKLALDFYFSDLAPDSVTDIFADPEQQSRFLQINLPVSGRVSTIIDINQALQNQDDVGKLVDKAFDSIRFQFEGGQGDIIFDDNPDSRYDVSSFLLEGNVSGGINNISIKNAAFDLGEQKTQLGLEVSGFKNYFLTRSLDDLKVRLSAAIDEMPVDKLYDYWPKYIATPGWNWCHDSMRDGMFRNAVFNFDFGYDKKSNSFSFLNLDGQGEVDGVSIDYLTGMPKIVNAQGKAFFSSHNIKIETSYGESDGVTLRGGYVDLYDLDKEDNFADISLEMESSVRDALRLIDNKPLQYTSEMGLNPDAVSGSAKTKLGLKFEMKQNLTPAEVGVDVSADISDFAMKKVFDNKDIFAEKLKLSVDNKGLSVVGDAKLDDIPVNLDWRESFADKNYQSRYKIGFKYDDNLKKKLGLDISLLQAPYLSGYADMTAEITIFNDKRTEINLNGDLKPMDIDFSFFGFRKPTNAQGRLAATLEIADNKLKSVSNLSLSNDDISLAGSLGIDAKGRVKLIDINQINGVKTNAKARIDLAYEPKMKAKINISGQSYNLSPFFERSESKIKIDKKSMSPKAPEDNDDELEDTIDADIFIAVNNLWTNPHIAVTNFAGSAKLVNGVGIQEIHMVGNYKTGKNSTLKVDYVPRPNKEFYLSVDSNDAGATMKVLRIYDNMEGGKLQIEARRNKDKALVGHAKIRDFNIHNTPLVAKFLSVASFRGMLDLLTGEGISFSHLDAPFEYRRKQLMLKKAKAFGNVLGITANGTYDRRFEELDVRGQVAPAYSLNMILGKIPLVGNLLAGKDGTVFAADYYISGDVADASIQINPLSALSPNSLKETISSLFGTANE